MLRWYGAAVPSTGFSITTMRAATVVPARSNVTRGQLDVGDQVQAFGRVERLLARPVGRTAVHDSGDTIVSPVWPAP